MYTTYGWTLLQTVPCFAYCGRLDSLAGWHGDDFYTEGEPRALDEVDEMILASFKAKVLPRLGRGASTEGTILRRIFRWSLEAVHTAPDAKHVKNLASLFEVKGAKRSPTPSSRATGRGQRDVLELLTAAEATVFRSGSGIAFVSRTCSLRRRSSLKTCRSQASCRCWGSDGLSGISSVRQTWDRSSRTRMSQTRCWSGLMVTGVETP